jgi:mannan endo-1,4-beta-mannosidase
VPGAVRSAGLEAQYFDEMDLTALKSVRTDPQIELDCESDAPVPELQPGSFSVRWRGFLRPASSELYTFFAETSDGVRLWVDGQLIIDDWFDRLVDESSGTILLDGGKAVPIVMEYYKNTGAALARLSWATDTIGKALVPAGRLTHWNP